MSPITTSFVEGASPRFVWIDHAGEEQAISAVVLQAELRASQIASQTHHDRSNTMSISAKLNDKQILYIRSMGKALRVTAIFTDTNEANKYMESHDEKVVAEFGGLIFLAHMYDKGVTIAQTGSNIIDCPA